MPNLAGGIDMNFMRRFLKNEKCIFSYIFPVLLILCMFAVVISVGIHQLAENEKRIHEDSLSNLNLNTQIVSQQLNDLYVSLESVAPDLAFEAGFTQAQMLHSMSALQDACGFDFVVRTNIDGIAFNYLGKENINIANRRYIHEALQGRRACEYVNSGAYDPSNAYVILAVPVFYQQKVVGALHGSYKVSNFDTLLGKLADNGRTYSGGTFIFAADGQLISASNRKIDSSTFAHLISNGTTSDDAAAREVAANLKSGQGGLLPLTVNGKKQYDYYMPLLEVECCPWIMVTTMSQESISARTQYLKNGIMLLFAIALCITAALILSVVWRQRLMVQQQENAKKLSQALADARRANRAKSDFLSRMSHDMRTPLNGIIGMTYLAQEIDNPPGTKNCLNKIGVSSQFLLGLINDVLDMAKAESGKMELHPEPYDIRQFIEYVESVIKPLCTEKNIHLVFDLQPIKKRKPVMDPLRFNQICFNLLSNAVKYTPEGGTVTLRIHDKIVSQTRFSMELEISDTGIGMSEEFQKSMFESFTQENRSDISQTRGTGLGLAIVKKVIELMNGSIEVCSELGEGTTFRIQFEFDSVPAEPIVNTVTAEHTEEYISLAGKHILLCEDHPLNQEIAQTLLHKKNMIVVIAENGLVGIEKFSGSAPGYYDAILMDIRMPIINGYEATRKIRAMNRSDAKSVPIIAMTADIFSESIQEANQAGMNAYMTKPIDPRKLFDTLRECMGCETHFNYKVSP